MITQCIFAASVLAVALSIPVTQEEYARYIAQQQTQRLEQSEKPSQPARRPVQLVQLVSPSGAAAYQQQQPTAPRLAYQPAAAAYQPAAAAYQPQPSYQEGAQTYQQPEEYQPQEQLYQPAGPPRAQIIPRPKAPPKPKSLNRPDKPEDEENDNNPNAQYQFSFDISDDESTNYHNRKEQRDGQKISGSYSVVDSDGFIRTVTYTADPEEGFKAEVSREPTNIQVKIPTPAPQTASPTPSQYRLPERKPQPQYIAVQASEPESVAAQPADPISGYYRAVPSQQVKAPAHRFTVPNRQSQLQAGKSAGLAYAVVPAPSNSPAATYQAYEQ